MLHLADRVLLPDAAAVLPALGEVDEAEASLRLRSSSPPQAALLRLRPDGGAGGRAGGFLSVLQASKSTALRLGQQDERVIPGQSQWGVAGSVMGTLEQ